MRVRFPYSYPNILIMSWTDPPEWVKNLKIGDKVYQIERHPSIPNGKCNWSAIVIKIENNYIETEYSRDQNVEWLKILTLKLASNHRTFGTNTQKNYFDNDGNTNIENF